MKNFRIYSVFVILVLVGVIAGCSLGIAGSNIPAGTYAIAADHGTWTLVLEAGSFDYKYVTAAGDQTVGWKGTFTALTDEDADDFWVGELVTLEEWVSGTTYDEVTIAGQTIKLTYYEDYPLDEVETAAVSFYLDVDGDGSYANIGGNITLLGMLLSN